MQCFYCYPFWYFFILLTYFIDSHRCLLLHILMYHFFAYVGKRNNATVTYFLKIYGHIHFSTHLNFRCLLPLSCVFLANYVPKCQMSSGPYGIIFICMIVHFPPFWGGGWSIHAHGDICIWLAIMACYHFPSLLVKLILYQLYLAVGFLLFVMTLKMRKKWYLQTWTVFYCQILDRIPL